MKKQLKLIIGFLFGFGMFFMSNTVPIINAEASNLELVVMYKFDNVLFNLYQIASLSDNGTVNIESPFRNYPINLSDIATMDSNQQAALLQTLISYAENDLTLVPNQTSLTEEMPITLHGSNEGSSKKFAAKFTNLHQGIYLVTGESTETMEGIYQPSGSIVLVDGNNQPFILQVKFSLLLLEKKMNINAFKVWKDDNYANRPKSIILDLMKEKEMVDSAELNNENQWQVIWNDLPVGDYQVIERDVPTGYQVMIEKDGDNFRIENSLKEKQEETTISNETTVTTESMTTTSSTDNLIPFTGQIWWPIPVLMVLSITFYIIGSQKDDEMQ